MTRKCSKRRGVRARRIKLSRTPVACVCSPQSLEVFNRRFMALLEAWEAPDDRSVALVRSHINAPAVGC